MRFKKGVAFVLASLMTIQIPFGATASEAETNASAKLHTRTWTMDTNEINLRPLTASRTAMVDEGTRLISAEGEAQTVIQSIHIRYCQ